MQLSKNFSLEEFTKSNEAIRAGINNTPSQKEIDNLTLLCFHILQPLRDSIGIPISITSGFRSNALNKLVKGAKDSKHLYGQAADLELWMNGREETQKLFFRILSLSLPFTTLIWEFGDKTRPDWVHVDYDKDAKKQTILRAYKVKDIWGNKVTKYEDITNNYLKH